MMLNVRRPNLGFCILLAVCIAVACGGMLRGSAVLAADDAGRDNADDAGRYLVGCGTADITGSPVGIKMLGYVRPDQITEGLHLRQFARTFVIAQADSQRRLAIVTTDLQSVTHSLVLSVLERLHEALDDTYRLDNVVIAATHTHAVPGGYWHYAADTPVGMPFNPEYYDAIVDGIVASIVQAHQDLRPGRIRIGTGETVRAGAQRSRLAYLKNPEQERNAYPADIDTGMTLLRFEVDDHPIGILNWHAVHPTSMSFNNKLISSDNKGYAAYAFERTQQAAQADGHRFVAAFAQSNCGDVTPNLNLKGAGPGADEFESTRIIGQRMADAAQQIFASASEELRGPIDFRHAYVDMGNVTVDAVLTHDGPQKTVPPAYGYSFAAGSTEDGGGQPMFREGMLKTDLLIEGMARTLVPLPEPSEEMRRGHQPKPILLAVGAAEPSAVPRVLPIGVARIGQLALVIGPAEYTTMSGRRFRRAIKKVLPDVSHVVVAGYAGDYCGYVATYEEYQAQHYEGASTLFGPWTQAAYQQEFARLAADMAAGRPSTSHAPPLDVRGMVRPTSLGTEYDLPPEDSQFGDVVRDAETSYARGDRAEVAFWTGNPQNGFRPQRRYAAIERQGGSGWHEVARDGDWEVRCRWSQPKTNARGRDRRLAAHQFAVRWDIPADAEPGSYRVRHFGVYRAKADGELHAIETESRTFEVD